MLKLTLQACAAQMFSVLRLERLSRSCVRGQYRLMQSIVVHTYSTLKNMIAEAVKTFACAENDLFNSLC